MSDDIKYPKNYDIGWEKWVDAYEQELEDATDIELEYEEEDIDELDSENIKDISALFGHNSFMPMIKSIMTPYGILPLTEQSLASKHFKFWVGHTNFMLGDGKKTSVKDFEKLIGSVLGVESIDILTSYRFRIAIAKMFKDREVMDNIKRTIIGFMNRCEHEAS